MRSLADESVALSADRDTWVQLLKVQSPRPVEDNRDTYTRPTGSKMNLILRCRGAGVWSTGDSTDVVLMWEVDADGDHWVSYRPAG